MSLLARPAPDRNLHHEERLVRRCERMVILKRECVLPRPSNEGKLGLVETGYLKLGLVETGYFMDGKGPPIAR